MKIHSTFQNRLITTVKLLNIAGITFRASFGRSYEVYFRKGHNNDGIAQLRTHRINARIVKIFETTVNNHFSLQIIK